MATGFSSDSGNSDDDGSLGAGLDDTDDEIVSQFGSTSKRPSNIPAASSKGKSNESPEPLGRSNGYPKPSSRNLTGRQSPPKASSRTTQKEQSSRKSRSPSPESLHALRKESKSPTPLERGGEKSMGKPPIPRPRTSSLSDSPRSLEPSPRERLKPSPRLSSLDKAGKVSPGREELDDLLGYRKEPSRKSNIDDLIGGTHSMSQKDKSPRDVENVKKRSLGDVRQGGKISPKGEIKINSKASPRDDRLKSPLSDLLEGKQNIGSKDSQSLDELLGIKSKQTKLGSVSRQERAEKSNSRTQSPSPKIGKSSPTNQATSKKKGEVKGHVTDDSGADKEVSDIFLKGRQTPPKTFKSSKSPDILDLFDGERKKSLDGKKETKTGSSVSNKSSASGQKSPVVPEPSAKNRANSPGRSTSSHPGNTTSKDSARKGKIQRDAPKSKSPLVENGKTGKESPLEKMMLGDEQSKKGLLDSDSDERNSDKARKKSSKISLLDVLDGSPPDTGKGKGKRQVIPLDTEDEDNQPSLKFTDRRPKGGYESDADSDLEAELAKAKRITRPTPKRPQSGRPGSGRISSSSSRTLSMENMNTLDSSSIREAMYETWRVRKNVELKKKKKLEKKKMEAEMKQKEKEAEEKRADATASYHAWKDKKKSSLVAKKREAEEKKRKQRDEEEEKMSQKMHAEKAFDSWKKEKDKKIKKERSRKERMEMEKTMTMQEKEEEKRTDAERAFTRWNADKEKRLKAEARAKREQEEELQYTREVQLAEKEENSIKAYQKWEDDIERRKTRQRKQLRNAKPISPYPFRPSSNTVPFGR